MDHNEREVALRAHVRELLLAYALTHLTVNYVQYTEDVVSEILVPSLYMLPSYDPTLPMLEPTLRDQINSCLGLKGTSDYSEKWAAGAQTLAVIKRSIAFEVDERHCPTVTCWNEENAMEIIRPFSPVLSACARRETPRIGSKSILDHTPRSFADFSDKYPFRALRVEEIHEPGVSLTDALRNRIPVDASTHSEMLSLLKSTLNSGSRTMAQPVGMNMQCECFIRSDSPAIELPQPLSPPIFSSDLRPGTGMTVQNARSGSLMNMKDLCSLIEPEAGFDRGTEGNDLSYENRYVQDMHIVDGWHTLPVSSSPTPSLEDEVDPKWLLSSSSPLQLPFVDMMDEYELPRQEKIGATIDKKPRFRGSERLDDLLSFLHPIPSTSHTAEPRVKVVTSPKSVTSSPQPSITAALSMLGQPPTAFVETSHPEFSDDGQDRGGPSALDSEDGIGLRALIKALDSGFEGDVKRGFDPSAYILRERLDENETMLMDVPDLPPPNLHPPTGPDMPAQLCHLVQEAGTDSKPTGLRKVKGLQSLNIELSWRPFNFGNAMPTHEEVARLTGNIQRDCLATMSEENISDSTDVTRELSSLLAEAESTIPAISVVQQKWQDEDEVGHFTLCTTADEDDVGLILTAEERRRLHGLPDPDYQVEDSGHKLPWDAIPNQHEHPNKRPRISMSDDSARQDADPVPEFTRADEREYLQSVNDSGVCLLECPPKDDDCESRTSYLQLADSGDGFDGPEDDLDQLFGDIDPIHFNDFGPLVSDPPRYSGRCLNPELLAVGQHVAEFNPSALDRTTGSSFPARNSSLDYSTSFNILEDVAEPAVLKTAASKESARVFRQENATVNSLTESLDAISAKRSLEEFMKLRSKISNVPTNVSPSTAITDTPETVPTPITFDPPAELVDHDIAHLLTSFAPATTFHRYLGSLDIIQKLGLTRALSLPECRVQLVERETLDGADIVTDPHTAVILSPLRVLPTQYDSLAVRINQLSWRFSRILVVFETVSLTETGLSNNALEVNPFSPPVVKAVKKLRRDMRIAEACLDKQESTRVHFAFPMSAYAAAKFIRGYGDIGHAEDTSGGQLWDDRLWLETEIEDLDERDLAALDGMNVFAAAVILSRNNLDDFLDKPAEQRVKEFGHLIGIDRIRAFNKLIARRMEAMQLPSSSPPTISLGTSNPLTPLGCFHDQPDPYDCNIHS